MTNTTPLHQKKSLLLLTLLIVICIGCTCPQKYSFNAVPPPLPCCPVIERPHVALVLGGGGAKGIAHVGVIEELKKANIPIDLIVGCSAGSIVGALYADNPNTEHLKEVLLSLDSNFLIDFNLWKARFGLCQGCCLHRFMCKNLSATHFDQLQIPFFVVATDLFSGQLVPIGGGPIAPAVQASSSIPLVFVPVELHGRVLVDGGVIDPVPVRVAKDLGADIIIAVDLRCLLDQTFPTNLFGVAARSAEITLLWQSESCLQNADVIIRPQLNSFGTFEHKCHDKIYEAGRTAALEAIPLILERLNRPTELCETKEQDNCQKSTDNEVFCT